MRAHLRPLRTLAAACSLSAASASSDTAMRLSSACSAARAQVMSSFVDSMAGSLFFLPFSETATDGNASC